MLKTIKIRNIIFSMVILLFSFVFKNAVALVDQSNLLTLLSKQGYQGVPIQLVQNGKSVSSVSPAVDCAFNDNNKETFSLDTGATEVDIEQKISVTNQFKPDKFARKKLSTGADGMLHEPKSVVIPMVKCSNFIAMNTVALVRDLTFMAAEFGQPTAGLIGMNFLRQYHSIIDISAQRIYFLTKEKSLIPKNNEYQHQLFAAGYQKILLESAPSGHVTIVGYVNDQPTHFLLDTGVPKTILSTDYPKLISCRRREKT